MRSKIDQPCLNRHLEPFERRLVKTVQEGVKFALCGLRGGGGVSYCRDHGNGLLEAVFVLVEVMKRHVGRGVSRHGPDIAERRPGVGGQRDERMPQGMEADIHLRPLALLLGRRCDLAC